MSGKASCRRVRFSPHITEMPKLPPPPPPPIGNSSNWRRVAGICNLRRLTAKSPSVKFIQRASDRVTRAIRSMFVRRRDANSSSTTSRPPTSVYNNRAQQDSHRTEAIEDCIKFLNSSRSFQRSNSVPTNLSYN